MAGIEDYSSIAAENGLVGGINIAESCPAGNLNDGMRAIMADLAVFRQAPKLGDTTITGTINVSNTASIGGGISTTGAAQIGGTLNTSGAAQIGGALSAAGDLTVTGNILFNQIYPTLMFNSGGPRIRAFAGNRLSFYKDGVANERMAIDSNGSIHVYGARDNGEGTGIGGSGNLRVMAVGAGSWALSTWHDNDYTPLQIVKYNGTSDVQVGAIAVNGFVTSYSSSSDEILKENFRDFDSGALIDALDFGMFEWKADGRTGYGVLAQQAHRIFPTAVTPSHEKGGWTADYAKFAPLFGNQIRKLRARIAALEARLDALAPGQTTDVEASA